MAGYRSSVVCGIFCSRSPICSLYIFQFYLKFEKNHSHRCFAFATAAYFDYFRYIVKCDDFVILATFPETEEKQLIDYGYCFISIVGPFRQERLTNMTTETGYVNMELAASYLNNAIYIHLSQIT